MVQWDPTSQDAKAADHNDSQGHLAHQRAILEEAEVVCSTCAGADHPVLQGKDFGCILIDEAGQTTELAVLVPLMKMRKDGVVTLVGDHRQLPPTISNVEVDAEGLGTSLFERLSSHGVEPFMLNIQYRSWLQCWQKSMTLAQNIKNISWVHEPKCILK